MREFVKKDRIEFGRPHSSSIGSAVAASVLHEARIEHQKTRKEGKRKGERRRWRDWEFQHGKGEFQYTSQIINCRVTLSVGTLEAFAFMSTVNFVTVALTVTGRWAKRKQGGREDGCA